MSRLSVADLNILRGASGRGRGGSAFGGSGGSVGSSFAARKRADKQQRIALEEAERQRQFELEKIAAQSSASQQESILAGNMRAAETSFRAGNEFQLQANSERAAYERARAAAKDDKERQAIDLQFKERMSRLEQGQRLELGQFNAGVQADRDGRLFGQQLQQGEVQQGYTQQNAMLGAAIQSDRDATQQGYTLDRDGRLFDQTMQRDQSQFGQQGLRDERLQGYTQQNSDRAFDQTMQRDQSQFGQQMQRDETQFGYSQQQNLTQNADRRESMIEQALMASEQRRAEMTNRSRAEGRQHSEQQRNKLELIEQQKENIDRQVESGQMRRVAGLRAKMQLESEAASYGAREPIQTPEQRVQELMVDHPVYGGLVVSPDGNMKQIPSQKYTAESMQTEFDNANRDKAIETAIKFAGMVDPTDEGALQSIGKMLEGTYGYNPFQDIQFRLMNKAAGSRSSKPEEEFSTSDLNSISKQVRDEMLDDGVTGKAEFQKRFRERLDFQRAAKSGNWDSLDPKPEMPPLWDESTSPPDGFDLSQRQSMDSTASSLATFEPSSLPAAYRESPRVSQLMGIRERYSDGPDGKVVQAMVDTVLMAGQKYGPDDQVPDEEAALVQQALELLKEYGLE